MGAQEACQRFGAVQRYMWSSQARFVVNRLRQSGHMNMELVLSVGG